MHLFVIVSFFVSSSQHSPFVHDPFSLRDVVWVSNIRNKHTGFGVIKISYEQKQGKGII
jgi:hypothetical protein